MLWIRLDVFFLSIEVWVRSNDDFYMTRFRRLDLRLIFLVEIQVDEVGGFV